MIVTEISRHHLSAPKLVTGKTTLSCLIKYGFVISRCERVDEWVTTLFPATTRFAPISYYWIKSLSSVITLSLSVRKDIGLSENNSPMNLFLTLFVSVFLGLTNGSRVLSSAEKQTFQRFDGYSGSPGIEEQRKLLGSDSKGSNLGLYAVPNAGPSFASVNGSLFRWESIKPPTSVDWRVTDAITVVKAQGQVKLTKWSFFSFKIAYHLNAYHTFFPITWMPYHNDYSYFIHSIY